MDNKNLIIISLGGSIIIPEEIDYIFLKKFREFVIRKINLGYKFIIVTGGGKIARKYNEAVLKVIENTSNYNLDMLGVYATKLNAILIKTIFSEYSYEEVLEDPNIKIETDKPVIVASGWKPGASSDLDTVLIAETYNILDIINLSNISYVYDKDPREYDDAKKLRNITWNEYRKIIPEEWSAGFSSPFDPIASKKAQELNMKVAILNGRNVENLEKFLSDEDFEGTIINN
ncbi:UMP kinase [bacterium]|nr:UMP kinase [bacterium]